MNAVGATCLRIAILSFLSVVVVMAPNAAWAHGQGVLTYTATTTEGYLVDVDYADSAMVAGVPGTFSFKLFKDGSRQEQVPVTNLWVRIARERPDTPVGDTLFAGPIAQPEFGPQGFLFSFPREGQYTLSVRFHTADTAEEEFTFPLQVATGDTSSSIKLTPDFFAGAVSGIFVLLLAGLPLFLRTRKTKVRD